MSESESRVQCDVEWRWFHCFGWSWHWDTRTRLRTGFFRHRAGSIQYIGIESGERPVSHVISLSMQEARKYEWSTPRSHRMTQRESCNSSASLQCSVWLFVRQLWACCCCTLFAARWRHCIVFSCCSAVPPPAFGVDMIPALRLRPSRLLADRLRLTFMLPPPVAVALVKLPPPDDVTVTVSGTSKPCISSWPNTTSTVWPRSAVFALVSANAQRRKMAARFASSVDTARHSSAKSSLLPTRTIGTALEALVSSPMKIHTERTT